ncbi:MAG: YkgJ family cysteine cluster protein [Planctomycetes bacterium]|nr:YkgJ family cysteine cluster protein [Planctomycetota bacterium]
MSEECIRCGAKCCRYFCHEIDTPESYEDFENIRWFIMHKGVSVHVDEKRWYMAVVAPCIHLRPDNRCGIYEDRPLICRQYGHDSCEASDGDYGYEIEFTTAAHVEAYAREKLGEKTFLRERSKHRLKAEKAKLKASGKSISAGASASSGRAR